MSKTKWECGVITQMSLGAAPFQATPMQLINKRVFLVFSAKNVIVLLAVAHLFGCKASHSAAMPMDKGENERFLAHSHHHNMDQSEEEICTEHLSLYCPYKLN